MGYLAGLHLSTQPLNLLFRVLVLLRLYTNTITTALIIDGRCVLHGLPLLVSKGVWHHNEHVITHSFTHSFILPAETLLGTQHPSRCW